VRRPIVERIPLGWRLATLVAAPLLVIAVVAGLRLTSLWEARGESRMLVERMEQAALIDAAIAALQQEREVTAQILALPDDLGVPSELQLDLRAARSRSDKAIEAAGLEATVPPFDLETFVRPWYPEARLSLTTIADLRVLVDRDVLPPPDAIHIYSAVVYSFIGDLGEVLAESGTGAAAGELLAYTSALASAESFIQARAWGTVLISSPGVTPREWILLSSLAQTEDFFLDQARRAPQGAAALDDVLNAQPSRSADNLRWAVIASGANGSGVTPLEWTAGTQPRVDALTTVTALMRTQLIEGAEEQVSSAERELAVIATVAGLFIVLGAAAAWCVARSISRPLERLAVGARDASVGRLVDVEVPKSRDAIGDIGRAYGALNEYLHDVADAAEEIARGDLTREIKPRSAEDRLGTALQTMTRQLASMVVRSLRRSEVLEETVDALQETAARDSLTGMLNRRRFMELVDEAIDAAALTRSRFGVLFIDLDGFKSVNDTLGHAAGDELLRQVASRLLGTVRVDDAVARLGGDEFTILVTNGFDMVAIEGLAGQIVTALGEPYFVHGETVQVSASVGLAQYPEHGLGVEELLAASDRAMYAAKHGGGNRAQVASEDRAA
jgi:diguanylate cyclase (GGDEF)-like protein